MGEGNGKHSMRIGDREVALKLRRHARARRITLRIDPAGDAMQLVLPQRATVAMGLEFAESKADWIVAQLDAQPPRVLFAPGSVFPILGRPHRICHQPDGRFGVYREAGDVFVAGRSEHLARRVRDFLKREAADEITLRAHDKAGRIDCRISKLSFRDMRSRWGSCSDDGRLTFSWRLIFAPDSVLDYVVAHEVAHLKVLDHSQRFWSLADSLTADLEGSRKWLRRNGDQLLRYG
jgi:predicted metal-dependent hydrolase